MTQPGSKIHVLLVNDDPNQVELTSIAIGMIDNSYIFESANSAEKALELIHSQPFDCIVSNFFLPRMNGLELCDKLRGEGYRTPFILFHVLDDKKVIESAHTFGVNDYLEKQPSLDNYTVLVQKIKSLVCD